MNEWMDVSYSLHYRLPSRKTTWPVFSSGLWPARLIVCPLLTIAYCPFPLPNSIMSYCSCAPHKFVLPFYSWERRKQAGEQVAALVDLTSFRGTFLFSISSVRHTQKKKRGNGSHPVMGRWESAAPVLYYYPEPIDPSTGHSPLLPVVSPLIHGSARGV